MKDKFPGHFTAAESNQDLWKSCLFVFDTNILLNLYRYSDETRNLFIKTLGEFQDRIWIPHRVAAEYLENRLNVIHEQQEEYEKAISEINKLKSKLENSRQHPFVSPETMRDVSASLEKATTELNNNKEIHSNRINSDEIKDSIAELLDGRVGDALTDEALDLIIKDGAERYKQKIPPGYSDLKKQSTDESLTARCRPYGDLIIWKSIIEKAKKEGSPVIFVTDDGKEDWWLRFKGKTLGPRPELIEEFKGEVNQDFHMYLPDRFLSFASKNAQSKPSKEILDEIRDIRNKEQHYPPENSGAIATFLRHYNRSAPQIRRGLLSTFESEDAMVISWSDQIENLKRELDDITQRIHILNEARDERKEKGLKYIHEFRNSDLTVEDDAMYMSAKAEHEAITHELSFLDKKRDQLLRRIRILTDHAPQLPSDT